MTFERGCFKVILLYYKKQRRRFARNYINTNHISAIKKKKLLSFHTAICKSYSISKIAFGSLMERKLKMYDKNFLIKLNSDELRGMGIE